MANGSTVGDPGAEDEFLGALYRGGELLAAGQIVEAREHLERAYALSPRNEKAQNLLGLAYFKLGLFDQASAVYEKLVEENPTDATLRVNLGLVFLKTNNLERCIKEFETATDLEPTHKKAHNYLGLALAQQGAYARAKRHFELAGSEQMADKMARALALQAPSAAPPEQAAVPAGEGEGVPAAPAPAAAPQEEEAIEVMSDEAPPVAAAEPPPLQQPPPEGDWGAPAEQTEQPVAVEVVQPAAPAEAFAPAEELPVVAGVQEEPVDLGPGAEAVGSGPSWLTSDAGGQVAEPPMETVGWVTEDLSGVPLGDAPEAAPVAVEAQAWATSEPAGSEWVTAQELPPAEDAAAVAPEASWEGASGTGAGEATVSATGPVEDGWGAGTGMEAPAATAEEPGWSAPADQLPTTPDDASWAVGPAPETDAAWAGPVPVEQPEARPSAPLDITVEEPVEEAPAQVAEVAPEAYQPMTAAAPEGYQPMPAAAPEGYQPMTAPRLGELGEAGGLSSEPGVGPFHLSEDGLAITVNGELLARLDGLMAIVGTVEVTPETRRRRGRSSGEPFGEGSSQLQRVKGNGVLYVEAGRARFHPLDLTDQGDETVDDAGAYLREDLVFAFEEALSFDNGGLSVEGHALALAHLKGSGRVLLRLEGSLRALPIPVGAPMVIPLHRLVGWYGRVSPRLVGLGGRGAVELTGEGYALLGTPAEGR